MMESHTQANRPTRSTLLLLLTGLSVVFLRPPCSSPEEVEHLVRAMAISRGDFARTVEYGLPGHRVAITPVEDLRMLMQVSAGRWILPPGQWLEAFHQTHHWTKRRLMERGFVPCRFSTAAPAPYVPQALTVFVAKLIRTRTMVVLYLARLANLAALLLMVVPALRWLGPVRPLRLAGGLAALGLVLVISAGTATTLGGLTILATAAVFCGARHWTPWRVGFALLTWALLLTSGPLLLAVIPLVGVSFGMQARRAGTTQRVGSANLRQEKMG